MLRYRGYRAVDPLKPYRSYQEKMSSRLYKKATKKQVASRRVKQRKTRPTVRELGKQKIARARAFHPEWQPFNFNDLLTYTHTNTHSYPATTCVLVWSEASFFFCIILFVLFYGGSVFSSRGQWKALFLMWLWTIFSLSLSLQSCLFSLFIRARPLH